MLWVWLNIFKEPPTSVNIGVYLIQARSRFNQCESCVRCNDWLSRPLLRLELGWASARYVYDMFYSFRVSQVLLWANGCLVYLCRSIVSNQGAPLPSCLRSRTHWYSSFQHGAANSISRWCVNIPPNGSIFSNDTVSPEYRIRPPVVYGILVIQYRIQYPIFAFISSTSTGEEGRLPRFPLQWSYAFFDRLPFKLTSSPL